MISINLNVKESAYDKIMYLLSHLKDDVDIVNKKELKNYNAKLFFKTLKKREIKIEKDLDIDKMMNEMNNGLS